MTMRLRGVSIIIIIMFYYAIMAARQNNTVEYTHITSHHHMEKTEAGLKGLYIREITTVIYLLICYY